jgi:hypothetical protein
MTERGERIVNFRVPSFRAKFDPHEPPADPNTLIWPFTLTHRTLPPCTRIGSIVPPPVRPVQGDDGERSSLSVASGDASQAAAKRPPLPRARAAAGRIR